MHSARLQNCQHFVPARARRRALRTAPIAEARGSDWLSRALPFWIPARSSTPATLISKVRGDLDCTLPLGSRHPISSSNEELSWPKFNPDAYELIEKLGKGSYGTVWRARSLEGKDDVAIKILRKDRKSTPRPLVLRKLQREADIMGEIERSSFQISVCLLGKFEDGDKAYLVMEAINNGISLQQLLDKQTRLSEEQLIPLCTDLLRFLAGCHENRIVYGDVKPANLLLEGIGGPVRVVDFGCSQRLPEGDEHYLRSRSGTPAYWAPEVFHKRYDTKADIWGLGVVLYQLVTGRYPWFENMKGVVPNDVLRCIENEEVPFIPIQWFHVSPEFRDLVFSMLENDPLKRLTAKDALAHPALSGRASSFRSNGSLSRRGGKAAGYLKGLELPGDDFGSEWDAEVAMELSQPKKKKEEGGSSWAAA